MSARATQIKSQLAIELGSSGLNYWKTLSDFMTGKIVRVEFEELVRKHINTSHLGESFLDLKQV